MDIKHLIQNSITRKRRQSVSPSSQDAVVLTSRVRLARNLAHYPFPGWCKQEQREAVLGEVKTCLDDLPDFQEGILMNMDDASYWEKQALIEDHWISSELAARNEGCAVAIDKKQEVSLMINEEDHLRLQVILPRLSLYEAWERANSLDDELEKKLDFSFSRNFGYLTSCPSNMGTGIRASTMVHLPGLVISGSIRQVVEAFSSMGLMVRGLFGEKTRSLANVFQISNQVTLGKTEQDLISQLDRLTQALIEQEWNARTKLSEDKEKYETLLDQVGRAFGILSNSYSITDSEALSHLSMMHLGYDLGVLSADSPPEFFSLLLAVQPSIIQILHGKKFLPPQELDRKRASYLRTLIQEINLRPSLP